MKRHIKNLIFKDYTMVIRENKISNDKDDNNSQNRISETLDNKLHDISTIQKIAGLNLNINFFEYLESYMKESGVPKIFWYEARQLYDTLIFDESKKLVNEYMPRLSEFNIEDCFVEIGSGRFIEIDENGTGTILKKYINPELGHKIMPKILSDSRKGLDFLVIGVKTIGTIISAEVEDVNDANNILKILGYYASASFAKDFCSDNKTYNYLQKKCINFYNNELKYDSSRNALLKYVDKDFLKVK